MGSRNLALLLEYNGLYFHGWQVQPGLKTVQGELKRAIETVLHTSIGTLHGSGRTDRGVHAKGQVANFFTDCNCDPYRLQIGVSAILKGKVSVIDCVEVESAFHARKSSLKKIYTYTILNRSTPSPFLKDFAWFMPKKLDVHCMRACAQDLVGIHDFSAFRGSGCYDHNPVKEIYRCDVRQEGDVIRIVVEGSGFLKNMVRIIVGTLVEIGKGKSLDIKGIIASRDRQRAGITAPAHGLCLTEVVYPTRIFTKDVQGNSNKTQQA